MPKPPKKPNKTALADRIATLHKKNEPERMLLKNMAEKLYCIRWKLGHLAEALNSTVLGDAAKDLDAIWKSLYTKGLDSCGPIVEDRDDIPF